MTEPTAQGSSWDLLEKSRWLAILLAAVLLGAVATADHLTGWNASFTLLYLAPIGVAVWYISTSAGIFFSVCAAVAGFMVEPRGEFPLPADLWNVGIRFGVYVTFCLMLRYLKTHAVGVPVLRTLYLMIALGTVCASLLAGAGEVLERRSPQSSASAEAHSTTANHSATGDASASSDPQQALKQLATLVQRSMHTSRPVLLGSRDPKGPSCVQVVRAGQIADRLPTYSYDLDGGPGSLLSAIYAYDRKNFTSPQEDYDWHQNRLRQLLANQATLNRPATDLAHQLADQSRSFYEMSQKWTALPAHLLPVGFSHKEDWPSYCLTALDQAVAAKNLEATKHWAGELAAAAFSLHDLHCWLSFLVENHLAALDFQRQCADLYEIPQPVNSKYNLTFDISRYPAGLMSLNNCENFCEVERQAERLFSMPPDRLDEIALNKHLTPASLWVMPGARESYLKLGSLLSERNRQHWELAARTPYEHSYLINMLYREWSVDAADELSEVMKKFDAANPNATVGELMGVLMYRGHSFAGIEWGDRFQPQLLKAAEEIKSTDTDVQALMKACQWTNQFYKSPVTYQATLTLRNALEQKRLDCVRATDMIGAIFRNAGRIRFGHVRWCSGTAGHSVAAYYGRNAGKANVLIVDGMMPPKEPEVWPDCYFHGHAWPAELQTNETPFSVEAYARGIDSYVWLGGYIIRGRNAGMLTDARVPYSPNRQVSHTRKVFAGPFPK